MTGTWCISASSPKVENGEIAAVRIGEEATLKRVYYQNGTLT